MRRSTEQDRCKTKMSEIRASIGKDEGQSKARPCICGGGVL